MSNKPQININHVDIEWDTEKGTVNFFQLPTAMFWINPSLITMLKPLADEMGHELFRLEVAASASYGTDEDYHNMVTALGDNFADGFLQWGKAVSSAGWGIFELLGFDPTAKSARVRVSNTWELIMQQEQPEKWGCPFIQGKIIGIFRHALGVNCWADEIAVSYEPENLFVEFDIYECTTTISQEIARERHKRMQEKERLLAEEVTKKTEQLQQAKIKAESASYAKSKFLSSMSHELRTPLNAVIGFSEILLKHQELAADPDVMEQLQHIADAGNNMLALVDQVLKFSEVSIDEQDAVREEFQPMDLIEDCLETTSNMANRRSIQISNLITRKRCPLIVSNSEYLREILLVFLSNAVRYIPINGNITVDCQTSDKDTWRILVADNGPGIKAELQHAIFEPFDRMEQSVGTISGAGIGLPLAKLMAGTIGARIGYQNNQPQGAIFWIDLPMAGAET